MTERTKEIITSAGAVVFLVVSPLGFLLVSLVYRAVTGSWPL